MCYCTINSQGAPLAINSGKVVAGLEPENTNSFFIDFVECANNTNIDNEAAVARCLAGEEPGSAPLPTRV